MTQLIEGRVEGPQANVFYGVPGVGKSIFASGTDNPVFIGPERNNNLHATKFPITKTHDQLMSYLREIETGKHDHKNFRTTVVDSIDMHEKVIFADICKTEPGKTMETARKGYGKAYKESAKMLVELKDGLEAIMRTKEMDVVIIGHSVKLKFNDPMIGTDYDRYEMCLHKGSKFDCNSIFVDWADCVLFLNWKTYATEDGSHAVSIGKREILTEYRPSHLAKNRYNFPYSIEMLDETETVKAKMKPQTYGIVQNYINEFLNSDQVVDTFQSDFNMLVHECTNLMNLVKDESIKPSVESAIGAEMNNATINPQGTLNNLKVIKERLFQIVSNQM